MNLPTLWRQASSLWPALKKDMPPCNGPIGLQDRSGYGEEFGSRPIELDRLMKIRFDSKNFR